MSPNCFTAEYTSPASRVTRSALLSWQERIAERKASTFLSCDWFVFKQILAYTISYVTHPYLIKAVSSAISFHTWETAECCDSRRWKDSDQSFGQLSTLPLLRLWDCTPAHLLTWTQTYRHTLTAQWYNRSQIKWVFTNKLVFFFFVRKLKYLQLCFMSQKHLFKWIYGP